MFCTLIGMTSLMLNSKLCNFIIYSQGWEGGGGRWGGVGLAFFDTKHEAII